MPFRCSSHRIFSSTRVSAWKMSGSLGRKGKDVFDSMCWKFISDSDTWIFVRFIQHLYCGGQLPSAHVTVTKNGANRASRASKWSYQWHGNRTRIEIRHDIDRRQMEWIQRTSLSQPLSCWSWNSWERVVHVACVVFSWYAKHQNIDGFMLYVYWRSGTGGWNRLLAGLTNQATT